jgi:hypothetical protein
MPLISEQNELKQDSVSEEPPERDGSQNDDAVEGSKAVHSPNEGFLQIEREYDDAE